MSHPYNEHRQTKVEHRRVAHIAKGHASGGVVASKGYAAGGVVGSGSASPGGLKTGGKVSKHRADRVNRARGGRTGKKHAKTVVNVITHGGPAPPAGLAAGAGAAPPAAPPMASSPPPMPPRPPMMPPGAGPGGPPMPPMPMRKHGGRVRGATKGDGTKPAPTGGGGDGPAFKEGVRSGTQVSHTDGKDDGKDIGRGKVVTYAKGGKVELGDPAGLRVPKEGQTPTGTGVAPRRLVKFWAGGSVGRKAGGRIYSEHAKMAPEFDGGAGGGEARLEKAKRAKSHYKAA